MAEKIYQLDPDFVTPAHSLRDDIDFLPTNRLVLWGHHFTAVAGAAPIIGPGIAVIWGLVGVIVTNWGETPLVAYLALGGSILVGPLTSSLVCSRPTRLRYYRQ